MASIETCPPLSRASVQEAARRIQGKVHLTPVLSSSFINGVASTARTAEELKGTEWEGQKASNPKLRIFFKCENLQKIGAFKPRGAFNALLRYREDRAQAEANAIGGKPQLPVRIVSHSSGNHAQAVALAASEVGYEAAVVMPQVSTASKIAATKSYGAKVHFSGSTPPERLAVVAELMSDPNFDNVFLPPYDHPDVMIGQGTMGLELQEQVPLLLSNEGKLDAIMTPCGGGGMLSGVALSCQGTGVKVFGSEPSFEGADDCRRGLLDRKRVDHVRSSTIADGLRTPVGEIPWSVISNPENVHGVFAVTDDQIRAAFELVLQRMKIIVEPSSAVPLAVALYNEDFRRMVDDQCNDGQTYNLALVVSGGNLDVRNIPNLLNPN